MITWSIARRLRRRGLRLIGEEYEDKTLLNLAIRLDHLLTELDEIDKTIHLKSEEETMRPQAQELPTSDSIQTQVTQCIASLYASVAKAGGNTNYIKMDMTLEQFISAYATNGIRFVYKQGT